jgi:putative membrane protein
MIALSVLAGVVAAVLVSDVALAAGPYGYGPGHRRHYFGAFILFLLLVAAVVLLVVLLMRNRHPLATPHGPPPAPPAGPTTNAQSILADRLARGEISPEDYRAAIAVLREPPPSV